MDLIVSDTNVFVALFRCNLLEKVFSSARVSIIIPGEIYDELTNQTRRISREYPDLSRLIRDLIHNPNHGLDLNLRVVSNNHVITNIIAMKVHFDLEEEAYLDRGERQAIPLTIELSATFLSCDAEAIEQFQSLDETNGSTCVHLIRHCEEQCALGHILQAELDLIVATIRS